MFGFREKKNASRFMSPNREARISQTIADEPFSESLEANGAAVLKRLGNNLDFLAKTIPCAGKTIQLFYFSNLIDHQTLSRYVELPLSELTAPPDMAYLKKLLAPAAKAEEIRDFRQAICSLPHGQVLLLAENESRGLLLDLGKPEARSIQPPETEQSVIGPKESFVENQEQNIAMIRKWLPDPFLVAERANAGIRTNQQIAMLYVSDVANPDIVQEVRRRLEQIDVDSVIGLGHLQELLEENTYSFFPQLRATERPDVVCSHLLEGHVAVLAPNVTHALIMPITFFQILGSVDDYYSDWKYATLIRFVRMLALFFSTSVPGLYVALVAYNPELIPTRLAISMDAARTKVALPIVLEIFIMEIMIEILRETGVKLPRTIGQAVSIIGGLVIGEASVNANLVSPVTVVIVALTAISSFTTPLFALGITYRILRFFVLLCSSVLGLYGFLLGLILIHAHLAKMTSFGVPYLAPLSPLKFRDWLDTFIRAPFKKMVYRPTFLHPLKPKKGTSRSMKRRKPDDGTS